MFFFVHIQQTSKTNDIACTEILSPESIEQKKNVVQSQSALSFPHVNCMKIKMDPDLTLLCLLAQNINALKSALIAD